MMRVSIKYAFIVLALCISALSLWTVHAVIHADPGTPTLRSSLYSAPLQADGCISVTLSGSGYTPDTGVYLLVSTAYGYDISRTSPNHVTSDVNGNFTQPVKICDSSRSGLDPIYQTTVFATYTTDITTPAQASVTIQISSPTPTIQAISSTVPVDFGCATVGITGSGFVPSTFIANQVIFFGQPEPIIRSYGPEINVLGGGNIATSFAVCGVKAGQSLTLYAWDLASKKFSNGTTFTFV